MTLTITETTDIATCRALRRTVFIEEQGVAESDEIDDKDGDAIHLLASLDGAAVGTARILIVGEVGKIGRVCVLSSQRGLGIGAALINKALEVLRQRPGVVLARLGAQTHATAFYEGLGFIAHGPVYDDAGIPHRDMDQRL